jgi:hypothetical protein
LGVFEEIIVRAKHLHIKDIEFHTSNNANASPPHPISLTHYERAINRWVKIVKKKCNKEKAIFGGDYSPDG